MNRLIALALAVVMIVAIAMIFTGCDSTADDKLEDPRFEIVETIYVKNINANLYNGYVIRDTDTGVNYLYLDGHRRACLTPLYDENGNVLVGETEGKEDVE